MGTDRRKATADQPPFGHHLPSCIELRGSKRLTSLTFACGYTLVAEGVETTNLGRLQHGNRVYNQLRPVQGRYVPVCLGLIDLVLPYYCDGRVSEHFLLLSWAGRPLSWCTDPFDRMHAIHAVTKAYPSSPSSITESS